jgi:UDP-N-acetylglucosamine acyltransferase
MTRNSIHPTAIVDSSVVLGEGNTIGAYSVLMGDVVIGDNNEIAPHTVIGMPGEVRNPPSDARPRVFIGDDNRIGEFCSIQSSVYDETRVGSRVFLMSKSHVGHDARVGDDATVTAGAILGGHVQVGPGANIGLGSMIHQRVVVGAGAMVGLSSAVRNNVKPWALCFGNPSRVLGPNRMGLERASLDEGQIDCVARWLTGHADPEELPVLVQEALVDFEERQSRAAL